MLTVKTCNDRDASDENCDSLPKVYPVVLGAPETSVFDSDSSSSEGLSEELVLSNQTLSPGSTVHIENSNDIVIGPLTQFHGPVTIYQNINSEKAIEDKVQTSNGKPADLNKTNENNEEVLSTRYHKIIQKILSKSFMVPTIVIFVLLLLALGIALSTVTTIAADNITSTESPITANFTIYSKNDWGGKQALNFTRPLAHPTEYVIISHTVTPFCKTFLVCSQWMRQMQNQHVSQGSPDIGYNFVIGADGSVYVGRGWDIRNFHMDYNVGISFTGNFIDDYLTIKMINTLQKLLSLGVSLGKLSKDYKIISHNNTYATLSPGNHVYTVISKLPHFSNGSIPEIND